MSRYNASHSQTLSVAAPGAVHFALFSTAAVRPSLHEINLGSGTAATPGADGADMQLRRLTSAGAGGGQTVTANKDDPLTVSATCTVVGGSYVTTDPVSASTGVLLRIGLRHEIPWRWLAYPGREIMAVLGAGTDGLGLVTNAIAGTAFSCLSTMRWVE